MKKLLVVATAILGMALLSGCESVEYYDSHRIKDNQLEVISEGENHYFPLNYFNLAGEERIAGDTILLSDEVKTQNTGFTAVECLEIISINQYGNYQVRRCLYKTSFEIIVTSWAHCPRYTYLPFCFEAEEIWHNGQMLLQQPWLFEKTATILSEWPRDNGETEYLLDFQITAHNRYYECALNPFSYKFKVIRLNEDQTEVPSSSITYHVTYDWHP